MAGPLAIFAAVGAALQIGGSISAANKQQAASRRQQAQERLQNQQSRRQAIREMQINRARAEMTAQGSGASGSSAAAGGIGGLSSQLGAQLGFGSQMSGLSQQINSLNRQAGTAATFAQAGQLMTSIAGSQGVSPLGIFASQAQPQTNTNNPTFGGPRPQARPFP